MKLQPLFRSGRRGVQFSVSLAVLCGLASLRMEAASHSAYSPIVTVDTRGEQTGMIIGQVLSDGTPLANAIVRVLNAPCATNSGGSGGFSLTNVPFGAGYVVSVAAPGFAPTNIINVAVTASPRDLGAISLRPLGARKVIPLVPDLNPTLSRVEEGGVAYRYYRVVSADGKTPAGGVALQARVAGGTAIPQTGEVADNWPGREAGVSDADGIVRIRIPSGNIGGAGTTRTVEVLDGEQVVQSFEVHVAAFRHEKVWGHRLDASMGGKLGGIKVEPGGALRTEITQRYIGSAGHTETIERIRSLTGKTGVEASVGSLRLGSVQVGATAGVGAYCNLDWSGKWQFPSDTQDGLLNMQKVYYAFGDIIFLGPLGAEFYGNFFYGLALQESLMIASGGDMHLGGYYESQAGFGIGHLPNVNLRAGTHLDGNVGGYLGYERSYSLGTAQSHSTVFGFEAESRGSFGVTAAFTKFNQSRLRGLGGLLNWGQRTRGGARIVMDANRTTVKEAQVELESEILAGVNLELLGWKGVNAPLGGDEKLAIVESYTQTFGDANSFGQLAALGKLWNEVWSASLPGSAAAPQLRNDGFHESCVALADLADQTGRWPTYERSVRRSQGGEFGFPVGANTLAAALQLDFTAKTELGAEMVVERGVAAGGRLFPQEYQPDRSLSLIPTESVFNKELVWLSRAETPIDSILTRFAEYVSTANPNLTIGDRFSMFFHDVAGGAQIVGSSIQRRLFGGDAQRPSPEPGQTNFIYGVSGLLQLTPTNAFPGTATLVILYSDDQVVGLNEADLRVFRLPDGANQWQLIGGIVNTVSNSITALISNFGTYAIAAPMPSGRINLETTDVNLVADGTNLLTLTATNLLLNTGVVATNDWLFTVYASGIELLDADLSTNWPGVQVASSNGILELHLRAPLGGTYASVSVSSVAGDAQGQVGINLIDGAAPFAPTNVMASAGQSRAWVSWSTNLETDLAFFRVYYRAGSDGPPYDGVATVEGAASPVQITATNCLLRGLMLGTNYFISVTAVDTSGNESQFSSAVEVTTTEQPPAPPTAVAARFEPEGTNVLMWALSEDDGYNDRDVVRYDVWRAVLPGGSFLKVGEVPAGIGLFSETNTPVAATNYLRYAVTAVDTNGLSSGETLSNRILPGGGIDNDGDGMADDWEIIYGLNPEDPTDGALDSDWDGVPNVDEFIAGTDPFVAPPPMFTEVAYFPDGMFELMIWGQSNRTYSVQSSTNLLHWSEVSSFFSTNNAMTVLDTGASNYVQRFYRVVLP